MLSAAEKAAMGKNIFKRLCMCTIFWENVQLGDHGKAAHNTAERKMLFLEITVAFS